MRVKKSPYFAKLSRFAISVELQYLSIKINQIDTFQNQ